jgi:hypothetical protein
MNPDVAKAGGLQSQVVKGEVVVVYLESLACCLCDTGVKMITTKTCRKENEGDDEWIISFLDFV